MKPMRKEFKSTRHTKGRRTRTVISAICVTLCSLNLSHYAFGAPALTFQPDALQFEYEGTAPGSMRGWQFDVLSPGGIVVTDLGVFDGGAAGFYTSHAIGIWNSSGNLLVSGTVPAGTVAPLDSTHLYRLVDTPDVVLPPGTGYRIAAYYQVEPPDFDPLQGFAENLNVDLSIRYAGNIAQLGVAALTYPTQTFSPLFDPAYFGPSFDLEAIPEPSCVALIISSMVLWLGRGKRRAATYEH